MFKTDEVIDFENYLRILEPSNYTKNFFLNVIIIIVHYCF